VHWDGRGQPLFYPVLKPRYPVLFLLAAVIVAVALRFADLQGQSTGPNLLAGVRVITNGTTVLAGDQVLIVIGTNILLTNNLTIRGKMVSVICKAAGGSVTVTNTLGAIFTFPGIGTNQTPSGLQLGSWGSPSNTWTGIYDGTNW
jgi:hypothetical protein